MCYRLWCRNPKDTTRCMTQGQLTAVYGTTCGDGKVSKTHAGNPLLHTPLDIITQVTLAAEFLPTI